MDAGRCDIDFHLPSEHLSKFSSDIVIEVDKVASIQMEKRDPSKKHDVPFQYIDISSVDVSVGRITSPQELLGVDAPTRARKVIHYNDIIISTCRPTRGAIAVIPPQLDNEICSTGFSIVKANEKHILPAYLHWALRLPSTLEQFRKWSTGSSYPAILDEDVEKTLIPVPLLRIQKKVVNKIFKSISYRDNLIEKANSDWFRSQEDAMKLIT